MKENLKLGVILLIISATAALLLSGTYELTKETILAQVNAEKNSAMKSILPEADKFETLKLDLSKYTGITSVDKGLSSGNEVGYVIESSAKGYGGELKLVTAISLDGKIAGVKVIEHTETPGLGAKCEEPEFTEKYKEKSASKALSLVSGAASTDGEIQSVSGVTITSTAVMDGVNKAMDIYNNELKGGQ
ncbi:MAG: RnfABCDGE type electron transport complex subunit G [Clostridium sp.]